MINSSKIFISDLLDFVREFATRENLNFKRLPTWMTASKIHVGWINNESMICVFRDAHKRDSFKIKGTVGADTVVLLDTDNFKPKGASLEAKDSDGLKMLVGEFGKKGGSVMRLASPQSAFFNCGHAGHHGPIGIESLFFEQCTENNGLLVGFVPFALYLHKNDIANSKAFIKNSGNQILSLLTDIHNSPKGDYYQNRQSPVEAFTSSKETGVIVLGKDSGTELIELTQVKDHLHSKGYHARLIKELPEIPMMSNEEKVRLWSLASRFVVMIDNVPTGHIAEYMMLKEQRTILALLRKRGGGSTYMIGDDHLTDINFIKLFEYDDSPLSSIKEVIDWTESLVAERTKAYNEKYPWRES
jgi:hypothetical protein